MKGIANPSVFLTVGIFLICCSGEVFKPATVVAQAAGFPFQPWMAYACIVLGTGFVLDAVYKSSVG